VPEPEGLVAEFVVPKPNGTWQKVRTLAGGAAQLLPGGFPLLVTMALGLPARAAEQVDGDVPLVGAVAAPGGAAVAVVGLHVRDAGRFVAAMAEGPEARHVARPDAAGPLTLLEAKAGSPAGPALGVLGNYALVGPDAEALRRLGPYVARTLGAGAPPGGEGDAALVLKRRGLGGPVRERLRAGWAAWRGELEASERRERARHGGAGQAFAEPAALLAKADGAVGEALELLGDFDDVRATVTVDERGVRARAALVPAGGDGPAARAIAAMAPGPASPLLDLPGDVAVALLWRDAAESRRRGAAERARALAEVLGGRLSEADGRRVDEALGLWAEGRGDWFAAGASAGGGRPALYATGAVADAGALERGVRRLLALPRLPAFAAPFEARAGALRVGEPVALEGGGGAAAVVRFERRAEGPPGPRPGSGLAAGASERLEVAWAVGPDRASFAVAADAGRALGSMVGAPKAERLGAEGDVRRAVEALGDEASFALLALPLRALGGSDRSAAPLLVAAGRSGGGAWVACEAAPAAARAMGELGATFLGGGE
jgi:hypothetical protein